ncbi:MAG: tRNA (guanine(10)-N(2))-dimethyltransferase [Candidatus Geothermarchaeales archaeon]
MNAGLIREGKARIKTSSDGETVFYNPAARFSRSVGVVAVAAEGHIKNMKLAIADAFSATGVRGIRYFLESQAVDSLYLNDASPQAAAVSEENAQLNEILEYTRISQMKANNFLSTHAAGGRRFDFVDVDPFGSPVAFLDDALSAVRRHGVVAFTATDLAPLCGLHRRAALRRYGSLPLRGEFCHETASRIIIHSIARSCGRRDLLPEVLLTVFSEQYLRVYVRVSPGKAAFPHKDIGFIYSCPRCHYTSYFVFEKGDFIRGCPTCGSKVSIAGPLWVGPLHSGVFVEEMERSLEVLAEEADKRRLAKYIGLFKEESQYPPYFFDVAEAADRMDVRTPKISGVLEMLRAKGFKASRTHFKASGVKTDASYQDFQDAVQEALSLSRGVSP